MQKVWAHPLCALARFDETNTVLFDSDAFKVRKFWKNSVILPEYSKEDVHVAQRDRTIQEKIMSDVSTYINRILTEAPNGQWLSFLKENVMSGQPDWEAYLAEVQGKSEKAQKEQALKLEE